MRSARSPAPSTPTGLTRSSAASASPPATNSAVAYFVRGVLPTAIDADVSSTRNTDMLRGASYSFTKNFPVRPVTRQSIDLIGSPGW
jgi:hypothetical protein